MYTKNFVNPCPDWATALLNGFSQVLLQRNPLCGLLCLLAILITAPALIGGALLGALAGLITAQRRGYNRADRQAGLYSYNGVLLGLLLSHALPWSALLPPLIIAAAGLSSMLVHQWLKRASPALLPAYTAPFVLIGWAILALSEPSTAVYTPVEANPLAALGRGLGQVFLLDHPLAGLLIALGLLIANRYAAAWALLGAALGGSVALLGGEANAGYYGLYGFNAALAALAFSQTRAHPWRPLLAIILAIVLQPLLSLLPVPGLTAPFILACWLLHLGTRARRRPLAQLRASP